MAFYESIRVAKPLVKFPGFSPICKDSFNTGVARIGRKSFATGSLILLSLDASISQLLRTSQRAIFL